MAGVWYLGGQQRANQASHLDPHYHQQQQHHHQQQHNATTHREAQCKQLFLVEASTASTQAPAPIYRFNCRANDPASSAASPRCFSEEKCETTSDAKTSTAAKATI
jgi:hypothetical protein